MLILTADEIRAAAPLPRLIEVLRDAFRAEYTVPPRQITKLPHGDAERLLLCMPAFDRQGAGAVKLSTVYPDNRDSSVPTIQAVIVVLSAVGTPTALLDGTAVTQLRTAAVSALASSYLSRADSSHLLIAGTGALAPVMAAAHCVARPITKVSVWGRRRERVASTAAAMRGLVSGAVEIAVAESIEEATRTADIVCCATSSSAPILAGRWLGPGTFVDLVGSFSPSKRESDDDVVTCARIFVDTFEGAFAEAGDLLDPLARGVIERRRIEAELADLASGRAMGRSNAHEITLFKSVGTAIEDLAVAQFVVSALAGSLPRP